MKNFIIILFTFTTTFLFSQNTSNSKEQDSLEINSVLKKIDSLRYSDLDYSKMKKHYTGNKKLYQLLYKKAANGNKSAIDFLHLMTLSYETAIAKFGENEIKAMIYTYYKNRDFRKKFDKLNSEFESKLDSIKNENTQN